MNSIAILIHPQVSLAVALLIKELCLRAHLISGKTNTVSISLVGFEDSIHQDGISVQCSSPHAGFDCVIVPPFRVGFLGDLSALVAERAWLREISLSGTTVATACLGSLFLASEGLLDGRDATTHWSWADRFQTWFPKVHWKPHEMICESAPFVTAGGYLAAVDLTLFLLSKIYEPDVIQKLGQGILVDSIRQKQSVYARTLTAPSAERPYFEGLDEWIEERLHEPLGVQHLVDRFAMSRRNLHRRFFESFSMTPVQYIQLKRIEKAKELLSQTQLDLDAILARIGLSDLVSFRRVFQREIGLSPSQFRKRFSRNLSA